MESPAPESPDATIARLQAENEKLQAEKQIYRETLGTIWTIAFDNPTDKDHALRNINRQAKATLNHAPASVSKMHEHNRDLQAANERLQAAFDNAQRVNSAQADEMVQAREWSKHLETKIRKLHHAVNLADTSRNEASLLTRMWNILNDIEEAE